MLMVQKDRIVQLTNQIIASVQTENARHHGELTYGETLDALNRVQEMVVVALLNLEGTAIPLSDTGTFSTESVPISMLPVLAAVPKKYFKKHKTRDQPSPFEQ